MTMTQQTIRMAYPCIIFKKITSFHSCILLTVANDQYSHLTMAKYANGMLIVAALEQLKLMLVLQNEMLHNSKS